ncbi:hypothetical protein JCM3774_003712 [Rhodotorula dairenensis]
MLAKILSLFLVGETLLVCSGFVAARPVTDPDGPLANRSSGLLTNLVSRAKAQVPLYERCKKKRQIAMTFDDGPLFGGFTASLLEQYGGKGTYFVNGQNSDCIYSQERVDDLRARYYAGHVIGSHLWTHQDIKTLTSEELHRELDLLETALWKILGIKPRFFRPPYGEFDSKSLKVLKQRGYKVVLWDFDSGDGIEATPEQSIEGYKELVASFPSPHIALNHEIESNTVWWVMPTVMPWLKDAGYKFVDLGKCLAIEPYQAVGAPSERDSTWTCDSVAKP